MIIAIDTELMVSVANLSQNIVEEVGHISEIMNRVTTHDDWNCKERDAINEMITKSRKSQAELQDFSNRFAIFMKKISNEFVKTENSLPKIFQEIDGLLGAAYSVVNEATTSDSVSKDTINGILSDVNMKNPHSCYEVETITGTINVCEFQSLSN